MATPAQIEANTRNALLSTGPRTPEGKAAVSQNRTSHGLTGKHVILPDEDPAAFDALLEAYRAEHQPEGPTAAFLVQTLAQSQWKLDRIARLEARILAKDSDSLSGDLMRLTRYESATRRTWNATLKQLNDLRKLALEQQKLAEAAAREAKARTAKIEALKAEADFRKLFQAAGRPPRASAVSRTPDTGLAALLDDDDDGE